MKAAWLSASISLRRSANSLKSSSVTVPYSIFCKNEAKLNVLLLVLLVESVDVVESEEDVVESVDDAVVPDTAAVESLSSFDSLKLARRFCSASNSSLLSRCGGGGGCTATALASPDAFSALCSAVKSSSVTVPDLTLSRKEDKIESRSEELPVLEADVTADTVAEELLSLLVPVVSELVVFATGTNP